MTHTHTHIGNLTGTPAPLKQGGVGGVVTHARVVSAFFRRKNSCVDMFRKHRAGKAQLSEVCTLERSTILRKGLATGLNFGLSWLS